MMCNNVGHHADQILIYKWHYSLHSAHKGKEAQKKLESVQKEKKKVKDLLMQDLNVWKEICEGILT